MYHFNELGCVIGMGALGKKLEIQKIQEEKLHRKKMEEELKFTAKKLKYDEVMALKLPNKKLTGTQLKCLLAVLKRKTDKPFSGLKKTQLLQLWREWKVRLVPTHSDQNFIISSVHEVTLQNTTGSTTLETETELNTISHHEV